MNNNNENEYCHEDLKGLVLTHARRVRRLWFMGAGLCLCIGLAITGYSIYRLATTDKENSEYDTYESRSYSDNIMSNEGLQTGAAIGVGFTAMLSIMGCLSFAVTRHFVNKSTPAPATLKGEGINAMITSAAGFGPTSLLGFIAPIRTVGFTIDDEDGTPTRQSSQLFHDEIPVYISETQVQALKFKFFGKTAAILACKRSCKNKQEKDHP